MSGHTFRLTARPHSLSNIIRKQAHSGSEGFDMIWRTRPLLLAFCGVSLILKTTLFAQPADGVRSKAGATLPMPSVPKFPPKPPEARPHTIPEKLSLDEAKAVINELAKNHRPERRYESILRIKTAVVSADLPALLDFCDTITHRELK